METKICIGECKKEKAITSFHKDKSKSDGKKNICMSCHNKRSAKNREKKKRTNNKIHCNRINQKISRFACVPYCNDACNDCADIQLENVGRGGEVLTEEEDKEMSYAGVVGGQFARMTEDMAF